MTTDAQRFRNELTPKLVDGLWNELERQHNDGGLDTPYVDRDMDIIDGPVDMEALAAAAIDIVQAAYDPGFRISGCANRIRQ